MLNSRGDYFLVDDLVTALPVENGYGKTICNFGELSKPELNYLTSDICFIISAAFGGLIIDISIPIHTL